MFDENQMGFDAITSKVTSFYNLKLFPKSLSSSDETQTKFVDAPIMPEMPTPDEL